MALKIFLFIIFLLVLVGVFKPSIFDTRSATSQRGLPVAEMPSDLYPGSWIDDWKRPDGPARVGLQIGHLDNDQVPEELNGLRGNSGAVGGGYTEVEVAKSIAELTAQILQEQGVIVDIIPATVEPKYWADVFVAIHADGSEDPAKTGYKFSGPRRDYTGKTDRIVRLLEEEYEKATGFEKDPNITRNMRGYYAFSWWRYEHAIHPMTPGVIAETGFMTNVSDRKLLINNPEIPSQAIADALITYLKEEKLL